MKRIPLKNGKCALVDDDDYEYLSQFDWNGKSGPYGYARRTENGKTILMHREILKPKKESRVDHINGIVLDNQKSNLRLGNHSDNICNRKLNKNNTSGFKGVRQVKSGKLWEARIQKSGAPISIGYYRSKHDAMIAYDAAATVLHKAFARTNAMMK